MADEGRAVAPRRRTRRWPWILGAVVLAALVAIIFVAPWLARSPLERALSSALEAPVTIGSLAWNPLAGQLSAGAISVGEKDKRVTVDSFSAQVEVASLYRGPIVVEHLDIDGPAGTLLLD